ncbi:RecA family ATPase Rlp1 [Schizosaccharomyces octosporus yFS286]|uniref:RecA family ATPase Rlp1 n=1 Tax=Schizosaccharomyces octosporus (strain yFS286) TaxID=483514 RepID=S9RBS4_SCHOY|nr:RecA family ATPase Rlp1 [Schizosaccharomyces octosporus yFS286]EPX71569.1 RecA family ATPase Rlp1 [Schizosaccharomyces octosporus yFS286]
MRATEWVLKLRNQREGRKRQKEQSQSESRHQEECITDAIESLMFSQCQYGEVYGIEGISCSGKTEVLYHLAGNALVKSTETLVLVVNSEWDWNQERLLQVLHEKLIQKEKCLETCGCGKESADEFSSQLSSASSSEGVEGTVLEPERKDSFGQATKGETTKAIDEKQTCRIWKRSKEIVQRQCMMVWPTEFDGCLESIPNNAEELGTIWKRHQHGEGEPVPLGFREDKEERAANGERFGSQKIRGSKMRLAYIFVDGLSSFYWQVRLERGYGKRYLELERKLRNASKMLGCRVVCTNWCLNGKAHLPMSLKTFRTERRAHTRFYFEQRQTKLGCLFFIDAKGVAYHKLDKGENSQKSMMG